MNEILAVIPGPLPVKLALLALPMLPNLWGILHAYRRRFEGQGQVVWMLACVFLPVFGGLAYFLFGRTKAAPEAPQNDLGTLP